MATVRLNILDAIRARFAGHATLRNLGRVLTPGESSGEHKAATLVTMSRGPSLDTFNSDIVQWDVSFRFGSKSMIPNDVNDWLEAMVDAFEDAVLIWPGFETAGCVVVGQSGPDRENPLFIGTTDVELIIQREVNVPFVRAHVTS